MTQADEKGLVPDTSQSADSPFTQGGLPDAQWIDDPAARDEQPSFPVVGVGASAGGVEALQKLFKSLPSDRGIAYVVVHAPFAGSSQLSGGHPRKKHFHAGSAGSRRHGSRSEFHLHHSAQHFLTLDGGLLRIQKIPQPRPLSKAVDRLFISLAEELHERSICIVLTGADHDGAVGLKAIKAMGGLVMAQLPETAQHPGMPESAVHTGLVDYILPIEEMGRKLTQYIDQSDLWRPSIPTSTEDTKTLTEIVNLLCTRSGGDFRGYKEGMLMRRTKRRMALHGLAGLDAYLDYLRKSPDEVRRLGTDFLIKVTEFFHEPAAWQALERQILPKIIESIARGEPLRVWVAGCATGEEAYSIGITLLELMSRGGLSIKLNIIGSDLDLSSLEVARVGRYPESITTVLNPELLARYFIRSDGGGFVVRKMLRESVIFFTARSSFRPAVFPYEPGQLSQSANLPATRSVG